MLLEHRRAVEAGGARSRATSADARAAGVSAILGQVPQRRRPVARAGRGGARHGGVHHAGHPARALRRRNPATHGRADHGADRASSRSARWPASRSPPAALGRDADPYRLAAFGALAGVFAFSAVIFAAPLDSVPLFRIGTVLIGFGGGLFAVGTLTAAMALARRRPERPCARRLGRGAGHRGRRRHRARRRHSRRVSALAARGALGRR